MNERYEDAVRYIADKGRCSAGILQRKFNIGYKDAAALLKELEETKVVSPEKERGVREVYLAPDEVDDFLAFLQRK